MAILYGDVLLDDESNILVSAGDLVGGNNQEQAIGAIVNANSGNFRKWPTLAANLASEIAGPLNSRNISAKVQNSAFLDGWRVDKLQIDTPDLESVEVTVVEAEKITDNTISLI